MKFPRRVYSASLAATLAAAAWAPGPARAQGDPLQSLRDALSLISGGATDTLGPALRLMPEGNRVLIRIDLPRWTPPGSAVDATATQLPSGIWQIRGISLPPHAMLPPQPAPRPGAAPIRFGYSIAEQSGQARVDPSLVMPSTYNLTLGGIVFGARPPTGQATIARIAFDGAVTGEKGGLIDRHSHMLAEDVHFAVHDKSGRPVSLAIRSVDARYDLRGYDRAKGARLRRTLSGIVAGQPGGQPATPPADSLKSPLAGQARPLPPLQRHELLAMIDGSAGLFSGFGLDETLRGFRISLPQGRADIGVIHIAAGSDGRHGRIAAHFDIGLDDVAMAGAPPQFQPLLPHHIAMRLAVSGLNDDAVRTLLHQAIADDGNAALLRAEATALLAEPGARVGMPSLSADFGPLHLRGSARVRPLADGTAAVDLHLWATGLDALLQTLEADPATQRAIPMVLVAKGLGQPDGNRTVWNIVFDHGSATINGIPFGPREHAAPPDRAEGNP